MAALSERRVPGDGPLPCKLLFLGEAPGENEDRELRPFIGRAGGVLDKCLALLGEERGHVHVDNVIQYRPEGNANPTTAQVKEALPGLIARIEAVNPRIIVTLGAHAARVFGLTFKKHRGSPQRVRLGEWAGVVVPWYHPAYALRNPEALVQLRADVGKFWAEVAPFLEEKPVGSYKLVSGAEIRAYLAGADLFSWDFESNSPFWNDTFSMRRAFEEGFSVSRAEGEALYTTDSVVCIKDLLEDASIKKVAHNAQFEYCVCANAGITLRNVEDTKVQAFVLRHPRTGLKDLARSVLGIEQVRFDAVKDLPFDDPAFVEYACADSDYTLRLFHHFNEELVSENLYDFYCEVERDLPPILARAHLHGIPLDVAQFQQLEGKLVAELARTSEEIHELYPHEVNWNSSDDKRRVLYGPARWDVAAVKQLKGRLTHDTGCDRKHKLTDFDCCDGVRPGARSDIRFLPPGLALPPQYVEGVETPSTSIQAMRALRRAGYEHPLLVKLEYFASLQQALRNNVRGLPKHVQEDGRIHASFIQAGALETSEEGAEAPETGRLGGRGPNLMNVTSHGDTERPYMVEWAREIRKGFVAPRLTTCLDCGIIGGTMIGEVWYEQVPGSPLPEKCNWSHLPVRLVRGTVHAQKICGTTGLAGLQSSMSGQTNWPVEEDARQALDGMETSDGQRRVSSCFHKGWTHTDGTSSDTGGPSATATGTLGASPPHQWEQDGQSDRKPGTCPSVGTSGFDDVSALRRDDCNEIGHRWVGSSWVWLKCDVSKEEPHIGWIVSGDMNWWRDLVGGGDVYKTAASHAFKCDVSEVDKEQRQIGKRMAMAWLNRARQYGIRKSAWWMTEDEATEWCESMDEQYPRLTYWHRHELIPFMYEHGYVNTWFGRRCDLPHVFAGPTLAEQARGKRKLSPQIAAERECVPLVIQGTAADLLKIAAQRVDAQLDEAWGYIVSFVHDELNLLVREDMVEHVCRNVLWTMLDGLLSPSLGVEIGVGTNWGELEDWTPEVTPLTT